MNKEKIVGRLLEKGQITASEAVVLLDVEPKNNFKMTDIIGPGSLPYPSVPLNPFDEDLVPFGTQCSCNPSNGGSGICGCINANKLVPKRDKNKVFWNTSSSIDNFINKDNE